jgi:predicted nucleic acid-binding protein
MKDKVFLDTNIFIYSIDASPGQNKKRKVARQMPSFSRLPKLLAVPRSFQKIYRMVFGSIS